MRPWSCFFLGCGTVGFWTAQAVFRSGALVATLAQVFLCDKGRIREPNAITCPPYAGHVGRYKCRRLAEILRSKVNGIPILAVPNRVEELDLPSLLPHEPGHRVVFVAGLDDWQARLCAAEDIRLLVDSTPWQGDVLLIQVGLDRNQAQVCVFGSGLSDPCPACGLSVLPQSEPCIAFSADAQLLRGNLHREAQAAAEYVCEIVLDVLHDGRRWLNSKTNMLIEEDTRLTRAARRQDGCPGPHSRTTPLRWDSILPCFVSREAQS